MPLIEEHDAVLVTVTDGQPEWRIEALRQLARRRRGLFDSGVPYEAPRWSVTSLSPSVDSDHSAHRTENIYYLWSVDQAQDARNFRPLTHNAILSHITADLLIHTVQCITSGVASWPVQVILRRRGKVDMMQLNLETIMASVQRGIDDAAKTAFS